MLYAIVLPIDTSLYLPILSGLLLTPLFLPINIASM